MRRVGQLFNPDYKIKEIAGAEAFTANANALIGPLVKQLGSNPTDKDLEFFIKASPNLDKTPAGNRLLLQALRLEQSREIRLNEATTQFIQDNPDIDSQGLAGYSKLISFLQSVVDNDPLFTQGGAALRAEYQRITGEQPPDPAQGSSALDALIDGGFISPTTN